MSEKYPEPESFDYESEEDEIEREQLECNYREIAKAIYLGIITDDCPSPINNLTPLEQTIVMIFHTENYEDIAYYKNIIVERLRELEGGWDNYNPVNFLKKSFRFPKGIPPL